MAEFHMELISHWSDEVYTLLSDAGSEMEINDAESDIENEVIEDVNEN